MEGLHNLLNHFTVGDIEKLKLLLSIMPASEQKEIVTLRVFVEEYKNIISHNRSINYQRSVSISLNHLTKYFGEQRAINSISLKDVESFLIYLQQKVKKGYVVYYRNLKAAFNKAIDWNYVKENHFKKVKLPKKQKVHPAYIDESQLAEICRQLVKGSTQFTISSKQENNIVRDVVTFAFYTGMRLNEIVNLTWKNVNLTTRIITVGDEEFTTKGKNQRYIPVSDEVYRILMKILVPITESNTPLYPLSPIGLGQARGKNKTGFVFCKADGEPFTGDYFSKRFKRACKATGMDKAIHFHSLRHSFASNLAQKGVSLYTIKELLGHSSISTTEIYSHLNMDSLQKAIRTFDNGRLQDYKIEKFKDC